MDAALIQTQVLLVRLVGHVEHHVIRRRIRIVGEAQQSAIIVVREAHGFGKDGRRHVIIAPSVSQSRSEEHTSELQSLMRISYAVFCLKKQTEQVLNTTQPVAILYTKMS